MSRPRKVLFISADQWRGECLSALGHGVLKTPHLDALAAEGVLFKQHFSVTSPCGPARSSLHTGLYLMNHRVGRNGTPLDQRHTNLAKEVRKLGFDPVLFGYTDTSADPRGRDPGDAALRTYEGPLTGYQVGLLFPDFMTAWMKDLHAKGYVFEGRQDIYQPMPGVLPPAGRGHRFIPARFKAPDSDTNFMADQVLSWLGQHREEDWFMHCVFLRPHPPVITPTPTTSAMTRPTYHCPSASRRSSRRQPNIPTWRNGWPAWSAPTATTSTTRTIYCTCPSSSCGRCGPATTA